MVSRAIRNGSVAVSGSLGGARGALGRAEGRSGPAGVAYRAVVNSGGGRSAATPRRRPPGRIRPYSVAFDRDVSGCVATATLTDAQNGPALETPPPGRVTLGTDGARVLVRTFGTDRRGPGPALQPSRRLLGMHVAA